MQKVKERETYSLLHQKRDQVMEKLTLYCIALFFVFHLPAMTAAQSAAAPAPVGPINITGILDKAGQFGTLIRLLKSTQISNQIDSQLNNSNAGMTIFAPTDNAFSGLPSGTLNSLTDQQKVALIQFHVVPSVITMAQFQTVSNPIRTQAGDSNNGRYPLNVTSMGNQVNITTGVVNTTISNTIYSDSKLAVYQVDQVLLPLGIFGPPAPASAPSKAPKKKPSDSPSSSPTDSTDDSAATSLNWRASGCSIAFAAASTLLLWSF